MMGLSQALWFWSLIVNRYMHLWFNRNKRERKLLMIMMVVLIFSGFILMGSNIYQETARINLQLKKAKQEYEYVFSGAERIMKLSKQQLLKTNPSSIINLIQDVSSENDIEGFSVSIEGDMINTNFIAKDLNQIIVFITEVNNMTGLDIKSFEFQNSEKERSVQVIFVAKR